MDLVFSDRAWLEFVFWIKSDPRVAKKIIKLIDGTLKTPTTGIGKPEPLKHDLTGYWSRRINEEHRMIYKIENDQILVAQLRYHCC